MVEDQQDDERTACREVEEVALVEHVDPEEGAAFDRRRAQAAVEERTVVEVTEGGIRERERDDGQHQTPNPKRGEAGEHGDAGGDKGGDDDRPALGDADQFEFQQPGRAEPDVHREASVEVDGQQAADTGVRHLSERQLARPSGDDGDRRRHEGEDDDRRVEEEARRREVHVQQSLVVPGQDERDQQQGADRELRHVADPPDLAQVGRDRPDLRREGRTFIAGRSALPIDGDQDGDEEDEAVEADLTGVVPLQDVGEDADHDTADHRPGERAHPAEHGGDERQVEGGDAEVADTGAGSAAAQQDHRERGEEAADRPHDGRDGAGADAGEAGQARVVG